MNSFRTPYIDWNREGCGRPWNWTAGYTRNSKFASTSMSCGPSMNQTDPFAAGRGNSQNSHVDNTSVVARCRNSRSQTGRTSPNLLWLQCPSFSVSWAKYSCRKNMSAIGLFIHIVNVTHEENRDWREMLPWPFKSWIEDKCCDSWFKSWNM
jgi:hypothetical protein